LLSRSSGMAVCSVPDMSKSGRRPFSNLAAE
jgi:hypothetical protein